MTAPAERARRCASCTGAEMLAAVGRIAAAVEVPVSADLEAGYGLAPEELVAGLLEAAAAEVEDFLRR